MTFLKVEECETLIIDCLREFVEEYGPFPKSLGLDLEHILRSIPEDKLKATPNEIIKSYAGNVGKALTNLIKSGEIIISGSTNLGTVTFTLSTPTN